MVTVETRYRLGRAIGRICFALWPLLGRARANRWGVAAIYRFSRFRIGRGRWQRFDWRAITAPLRGEF
jgi:hypothetical protein